MVNEFPKIPADKAADRARSAGGPAAGLAGQITEFAPLTRRIGALRPPGASANCAQRARHEAIGRGTSDECTRATLVAAVLAAVVGSGAAQAQTPAEFYKGKDIRILIGAGVGGTYHLYAMLAARHMRKHIPGEPTLDAAAPARRRRHHRHEPLLQRGAQGRHADAPHPCGGAVRDAAQPGREIQRQGLQLHRPLRRCRLRRHGVEAVRREDARRRQEEAS